MKAIMTCQSLVYEKVWFYGLPLERSSMNIFEWLRDEVSKCSDEACFLPGDMMVISESRVKQLLDEAKARWEAENGGNSKKRSD